MPATGCGHRSVRKYSHFDERRRDVTGDDRVTRRIARHDTIEILGVGRLLSASEQVLDFGLFASHTYPRPSTIPVPTSWWRATL
jgi:hypothetical protein